MTVDVGLIANFNAYISGAISVIVNVLLIIAISKARSKTIGLYKWMMIFATCVDLLFSIWTAVSCPVSEPT